MGHFALVYRTVVTAVDTAAAVFKLLFFAHLVFEVEEVPLFPRNHNFVPVEEPCFTQPAGRSLESWPPAHTAKKWVAYARTVGRDYPGSAGTRVTRFLLTLFYFHSVAIRGLRVSVSYIRCPRIYQLSPKVTSKNIKNHLGQADQTPDASYQKPWYTVQYLHHTAVSHLKARRSEASGLATLKLVQERLGKDQKGIS